MQIIVIIYVQTLKSTLIVHFEISNKQTPHNWFQLLDIYKIKIDVSEREIFYL